MITGKNTFVYNNIFYAAGNAVIGETVDYHTAPGGSLNISNNLYYGNVTKKFKTLDQSALEGDPFLTDPGASNSAGYRLYEGSIAMNAGISFQEPVFPQAGKGIFAYVPPVPEVDYFGNPVAIATSTPHIGAYGGMPSDLPQKLQENQAQLNVIFDPKSEAILITWNSSMAKDWTLSVVDILGRVLFSGEIPGLPGRNSRSVSLIDQNAPGIALVILTNGSILDTAKVPVR
jgi:hypothetical protein